MSVIAAAFLMRCFIVFEERTGPQNQHLLVPLHIYLPMRLTDEEDEVDRFLDGPLLSDEEVFNSAITTFGIYARRARYPSDIPIAILFGGFVPLTGW